MHSTVRVRLVLALCRILGACATPEPESVEPTPGLIAFTGARLILGDSNTVIENGTLIVRDGRIEASGDSVTVPVDAQLVDASGKTIIPGLITAHGHVNNVRGLEADPAFYTEAHIENQLALYARYGVTTVFSLGGGGPTGAARDAKDWGGEMPEEKRRERQEAWHG